MDLRDHNIKRNNIPITYASVVASKSLLPPTPTHSPLGIADSGASEHYITAKDSPACSNPTPSPLGPIVLAADGTKIKASHSVTIPLAPQLSPAASKGHILNGLTTGSLISIGPLCDDNCIAIFSKFKVSIVKDGRIIITGLRNPTNGLWTIPLAPKSSPKCTPARVRGASTRKILAPASTPVPAPRSKSPASVSSAIRTASTKADLAAFVQATLFSPVVSTLIRAIKRGHFLSWPGLTTDLIL